MPDSTPDVSELARQVVDELDGTRQIGNQILLSRREAIALSTGAISLGALGVAASGSASAQEAVGQVGTESEPVDIEAAQGNFSQGVTVDGALEAGSVSTEQTRSKERPVSDVTAFGANPNDTTSDDTQAFLDAINTTPSGGIIFVPPGRYSVDADTITLRRGQRLVGVSAENFSANRGSVIDITGVGSYGVRVGDGTETTRGAGIEHVKIQNDGDRLDVSSGVQFDGEGSQIHTKLDHVTVRGFDTNWLINSAWGIHAQGLVSNGGNAGFVFENSITTSVFDNCIDYNSDGWGFDFQGTANSTVMNAARTDGSDNGIRLSGSIRSLSFVSPEIEDLPAGGTGIRMSESNGTMNLENPGFGVHGDDQTYIDIQNCRNATLTSVNCSSSRAPDNGKVLNVNTENVDPDSVVAVAPVVFQNAGDWGDITVLGGNQDNVQS